jgi:hypothetical protein
MSEVVYSKITFLDENVKKFLNDYKKITEHQIKKNYLAYFFVFFDLLEQRQRDI